ncbi:unnamed protein product [Rangifer tarandus platyrhynchus]|uniref:Uncharacterized protein n=1 Tax=Rangifer tarandus platyrhynchus TaxID=3082113 RepID=A0AC59Z750_RANTA
MSKQQSAAFWGQRANYQVNGFLPGFLLSGRYLRHAHAHIYTCSCTHALTCTCTHGHAHSRAHTPDGQRWPSQADPPLRRLSTGHGEKRKCPPPRGKGARWSDYKLNVVAFHQEHSTTPKIKVFLP